MDLLFNAYKRNGKVVVSKCYSAWSAMRQRCNCKTHAWYHRYGGRGINICPEWSDYNIFKKWCANNGIAEGLSLDRINNDDDYKPSNCRWANQAEQRRNSSHTKLITFNGETLTQREWGLRLGLGDAGMAYRLKNWSIEMALTTPKVNPNKAGWLPV